MQSYKISLDPLGTVWYYGGTLKKYIYTEEEYLLKKTMISCAKCALSWIFYFPGTGRIDGLQNYKELFSSFIILGNVCGNCTCGQHRAIIKSDITTKEK